MPFIPTIFIYNMLLKYHEIDPVSLFYYYFEWWKVAHLYHTLLFEVYSVDEKKMSFGWNKIWTEVFGL